MKRCCFCLKTIEVKLPVGRREICAFCGAELHCCLNCNFYTPGTYNECREPQAERVIEKDRGNFCDQFVFQDSNSDNKEHNNRESAKAKLESLFKDE